MRNNMKKINLKIILCLLIGLVLLTGCSGSGLSEDFDEEKVKEQAKEVVKLLNNKDSETILDMSTVEMKAGLTEETLEDVYATIDEGGGFNKFEDISLGGQKDKSSEEEFAVVVINAKYENKKITYTISFTKQMKLAGLYLK